MSDFLLELLSEEIPARMQARARGDLSRMMAEGLESAGLTHEGITAWSTPRRLALVVRELPDSTEAMSEELKGPRSSAPPQALDGFLRKTGLTRDQLEERDGVWFARIDRPGRATAEVLAGLVAGIVRDFPWPKSMRWGADSVSSASLRWVRPLHSIVALLGEEIVPVAIEGVPCGAASVGHRFHHPGPITIGGAHDYVEKLRACHVIVDQEERETLIRERTAQLADDAGYLLVQDEGLVVENAGLTEWPVPLLGSFDPDYLDVPEEVIQLTARLNQKYFVMRGGDGKLAPHFICVANIDAVDGGESICSGNARVLAARLADARFFWEQDFKVPLEEQAGKLGEIVFHEKLGTVADKVERVAKLARWLVEQHIVIPAKAGTQPDKEDLGSRVRGNDEEVERLARNAERAAHLAKADLVTGMVGEFPELQGVVGGYLARAQGEPNAVADAIRDHYKPVGQGDEVPTAPVTVAVSLADKLDSLICFFAMGIPPTGSKDPFALRRSAIGLIAILIQNELRVSLKNALSNSYRIFAANLKSAGLSSDPEEFVFWFEELVVIEGSQESSIFRFQPLDFESTLDWRRLELGRSLAVPIWDRAYDDLRIDHEGLPEEFCVEAFWSCEKISGLLLDFFADRLKVQQREAGVRHDLIDAVFALGGEDDLVRLLARVEALQAFVETGEGADLLAGYKRAANILKKEEGSWTPDQVRGDDDVLPEEAELISALDAAEPKARAAINAENFTGAMAALSSLRAPIDAFFDKVTVNAEDAGVRARRLNLLARFRDAVHEVADFSKIEG